jgi:hypothetical protein
MGKHVLYLEKNTKLWILLVLGLLGESTSFSLVACFIIVPFIHGALHQNERLTGIKKERNF